MATSLVTRVASLSLSAGQLGSQRSEHHGRQLRSNGLASGSQGVTMMSKRADQMSKIREMNTEEMKEKIAELKGELFILRAKQATRQDFKPAAFPEKRRQIARMLTVMREAEIKNGVSRRESKKMNRLTSAQAMVGPPQSYLDELASKKSS